MLDNLLPLPKLMLQLVHLLLLLLMDMVLLLVLLDIVVLVVLLPVELIELLLNKFQSNLESNTSHSKKNTLNMIESKESKEFLTNNKSYNINKLFIHKESQLKEQSPIIMPLRHKFNIFQNK